MITALCRLPDAPRPCRAGLSFLVLLVAAALASLAPARQVQADVVLNFESPPFPTAAQPNNFIAAGAMQTYTQAGVFTITGGVILGNPTFLASFPAHGSPPNLYGTTDFADPSLLSTITLAMPAAELVTAVSGVFFSGQNVAENYSLTAKSGGTTVGTATPTLPSALSTLDFFNFSFTSTTALPITSVTFTTPNSNANGWSFFVDTIRIVSGPAAIPEPSPVLLAAVAILTGLGCRWVRKCKRTG